jgi:ribosomal-protein-alanine N-acetyltransferase
MPTSRFTPFPVLLTERLVLRRILPEDDSAIYVLRSDKDQNKYIARPLAANVAEAREWMERINKSVDEGENINWAITLKDTGTFIGVICLWNFEENNTIAETGYQLAADYHGKGYMSEALHCVMAYGFSILNLSTIKAYTHRENTKSLLLLKKNGFTWNEGEIDEGFPYNVIYARSK